MIDLGANPHIRNAKGKTQFDIFGSFNLVRVPSVKSAFFPVKNFPTGNLGDSWCYTTGVYKGEFERVIGKGGEGTVIQGRWSGRPAAYKFVEMKGLKYTNYHDAMADITERLNEMTEMMATPGNAILPFEAHYR